MIHLIQKLFPGRKAMNDQNSAGRLADFENWLNGIPDEIRFWRHYLGSQGHDFHGDFSFRLRPDTEIGERDDKLARALSSMEIPRVRLLDVGAGPLTNLGKKLPGVEVEMVPCDPLADVYGWLLDENGITPPVRTKFADAENLSEFFGWGDFDAVHCANALDHSYDPLNGILEMLKVVSTRGFVQLGHWENEAEYEKYGGFHQWNFTERDGDFVIWNRGARISLRERMGDHLDITVWRIPVAENSRDWILAQFRKKPGADEFLKKVGTNLGEKYQCLSSRVTTAGEGDAAEEAGDPGASPLARRYHALFRSVLRDRFAEG